MAIDACRHSFVDMATAVLPGYMAGLRLAFASPLSMSLFCKPGFGVKSILSYLRLGEDFSGCYVLLHAGKPIYVGIARGVIQRVRQHVMGRSHNDASLAYLMATKKTGHEMKREDAMKDASFRAAFDPILGAPSHRRQF